MWRPKAGMSQLAVCGHRCLMLMAFFFFFMALKLAQPMRSEAQIHTSNNENLCRPDWDLISASAALCCVWTVHFQPESSCPALALPPLKTNYITIAVITFPDMTIPPCGGDITLHGSWIAHISIINSKAHPAPSVSHRLFLIGLNSQRREQSSDTQFISRFKIQELYSSHAHAGYAMKWPSGNAYRRQRAKTTFTV